MSAQSLLDRLQRVKQRAAGQWSARCPAHDDKGPSLSVKELDDGRVLVHCFAGCSVEAVLGAVGLGFDDLFPHKKIEHGAPARKRLVTASQGLEILSRESLFVYYCASDLAIGKPLSDESRERLLKAVGRIRTIHQEWQR